MLVVVRNGQTVLGAETERFRSLVEYDDDKVVRRLRPVERTPSVVMDPARAFGQPAVRNVRTDVLAEDYRAGASRDELADLYELTPEQVDAALRSELISSRENAA